MFCEGRYNFKFYKKQYFFIQLNLNLQNYNRDVNKNQRLLLFNYMSIL